MQLLQKIKRGIALSVTFSLTSLVFALPASAKVAYPIPELGNCRDGQECFYYCEIPANQEACTEYSQFHFLPQVLGETTTAPNSSSTTYSFPIKDLGNCGSPQECSTYCGQAEHKQTCTNYFSKRTPPKPSYTPNAAPATQEVNQQFLNDAKSFLGCTSYESCSEYCKQSSNRQKCEEFGKAERQKGVYAQPPKAISPPTGNSNGTVDCNKTENANKCRELASVCGSFCRQNPRLCQSGPYTPPPSLRPSPKPVSSELPPQLYKLRDATGCKTLTECSTYCKTHQEQCQSLVGDTKNIRQ